LAEELDSSRLSLEVQAVVALLLFSEVVEGLVRPY